MGVSWRRRTQFTKAKFRPYTKAIGEFALAWNDLHEVLGDLFVQAIAGEEMPSKPHQFQARGLWGCVTSDRQKRVLLDGAINLIGAKRHDEWPRIADDVIWLLAHANKLEDRRNNVIHAPLEEQNTPIAAALLKLPLGAIAPAGRLNERASKLERTIRVSGRHLLGEDQILSRLCDRFDGIREGVVRGMGEAPIMAKKTAFATDEGS